MRQPAIGNGGAWRDSNPYLVYIIIPLTRAGKAVVTRCVDIEVEKERVEDDADAMDSPKYLSLPFRETSHQILSIRISMLYT